MPLQSWSGDEGLGHSKRRWYSVCCSSGSWQQQQTHWLSKRPRRASSTAVSLNLWISEHPFIKWHRLWGEDLLLVSLSLSLRWWFQILPCWQPSMIPQSFKVNSPLIARLLLNILLSLLFYTFVCFLAFYLCFSLCIFLKYNYIISPSALFQFLPCPLHSQTESLFFLNCWACFR